VISVTELSHVVSTFSARTEPATRRDVEMVRMADALWTIGRGHLAQTVPRRGL